MLLLLSFDCAVGVIRKSDSV